MTSTNLKKYVYSKNCLKQRRQPPPPQPTPPSSKVEGIFVPKKSPGYSCYLQLNMPTYCDPADRVTKRSIYRSP